MNISSADKCIRLGISTNSVSPITSGTDTSGRHRGRLLATRGGVCPVEAQRSSFSDTELILIILGGSTDRLFFSDSGRHDFGQLSLARNLPNAPREASSQILKHGVTFHLT
jgi:hypothetical protein